jgi:hypothetical protein
MLLHRVTPEAELLVEFLGFLALRNWKRALIIA